MDLSTLVFKTETSGLERAGKALEGVVSSMAKLDKASQTAARTEATLAKAAKDNASAAVNNAKAQVVSAKAVESAEKAQKSAATEVARNTSILERQKNILEFQTQGFSKGQSSILAYGKAAGLVSADINELGKVLETQRKLMGSDPFDKSLSGIKSLQNQYTELKESVRQYATDSNLSVKQTRELARDKERLIEKMKVEGASFSDIRKAVRAHNDEYVTLASSYNKMTSAEDAVIKSRKDAVNATNYLTTADQKMSAALSTSNMALDKSGTDSLVRYESALRKSGLAQDVVTQKLSTYKIQLAQVQAQEAKRSEQHLARALPAQFTDIGVSLYSGQNPLTVLLQQSGQILDIFQLSGVAADKFAEATKRAFYSMVPAMATVAKGLTGLIFGLFYDAGKGITNFIGNVTGMNKVLQSTDDLLFLVGGRATQFSKVLNTLGTVASATFGAGIFVIIAGLAALAVGIKQVITENNDLAKAFALSGGSIGASHAQVIDYVKTLAASGATTGQATEALVAMAKAGTFTSKEILLVSDSAIQMQKGFGIAIGDTVKEFAKLKEKPVEALLEIAKTSGMVSPEIIKMVMELERAGKTSDAAALAMKTYADVNREKLAQMKEDYNGFSLFIIQLGQGIKQFFSDTFKALFLSTSPSRQLENQLGIIQGKIKEIKTFGSLGRGDELKGLEDQERILQSRISATVRLQGEEDKIKLANAESAKYEDAALKIRKSALDAIEKETGKTQTLADFRKSFVEDKLKEAAKEKGVDVEKLKLNTELITLLEKQAGIEFKKNQKKGSSKLDSGNIAKHQLDKDISNIRKTSEAEVKAYSDGESVLEALRSAGLVDMQDYYTSKKMFLELTDQASEDALQKEIDRLKKEVLIGTDKIDNDKKIAEATAKLALAKEKSTHKMTLLSLQEGDANKKLAQSYRDAEYAAQSSLDAQRLAQTRELSGIGLGTAERNRLSGRSQKEDQFSLQLRNLEKTKSDAEINGTFGADAQDKYNNELDRIKRFKEASLSEYDSYYAERLKQESDWTVGASEAMANYFSEAQNIAKSTSDMFTTAFQGMTDGVASSISAAILQGKSLEDSLRSVAMNVADAFITSFIKIQIQKLLIDKTAQTGYAATMAMESQAMVAMAGLNAFAATAAIPMIGPLMAPGAAATATAIAEGFAATTSAMAMASVASAEGGYDIPAGVNPMTQLHEQEMVLPKPQANVIRDMAKNGNTGSSTITIVNNTSAKIGKVTEQRMSDGERVLIIEEATQAAEARINAAMSDPNSKTSKQMSRNFSIQRSR